MRLYTIVVLLVGLPLAVKGQTYTLTTSYEGSNLYEQLITAELAKGTEITVALTVFPSGTSLLRSM